MTLNAQFKSHLVFFGLLFISFNSLANDPQKTDDLSPEERAWLEDDSSAQAREISSGELRWVTPDKTLNQYRLENTLTVHPESLKTGWIDFSQCHYQLDPRIAVEIVYGVKRTQNLKVISSQRIGHIETAEDHITLTDIQKNAQICISGKTKVLNQLSPNHYKMLRGPYMRRFLDGFYPMQVTETIRWQGVPIKLNDLTTHSALGYDFKVSDTELIANYWFEGLLKPFYEFSLRSN